METEHLSVWRLDPCPSANHFLFPKMTSWEKLISRRQLQNWQWPSSWVSLSAWIHDGWWDFHPIFLRTLCQILEHGIPSSWWHWLINSRGSFILNEDLLIHGICIPCSSDGRSSGRWYPVVISSVSPKPCAWVIEWYCWYSIAQLVWGKEWVANSHFLATEQMLLKTQLPRKTLHDNGMISFMNPWRASERMVSYTN